MIKKQSLESQVTTLGFRTLIKFEDAFLLQKKLKSKLISKENHKLALIDSYVYSNHH